MGNKATAPAGKKAKAQAPAKAEAVAIAANPLNILLPYQRAVVDDPSRFVACCFSRQSGKSFTVAAREARRLMTVPKLTVVIAAPSERQSHESLEKVKDWLRAFGEAYADEEEFFSGDDIEKSFKAKAIKLPNESRCIAVRGALIQCAVSPVIFGLMSLHSLRIPQPRGRRLCPQYSTRCAAVKRASSLRVPRMARGHAASGFMR